MPICCDFGVAPTKKPVFKSCAVVPPLDAAMQTTPAIVSAVSVSAFVVLPSTRKIRQVNSSVATVIPEIGFDDDPISPVNRDDTVTNKNPKMMTSPAPSKPCSDRPKPSCGE